MHVTHPQVAEKARTSERTVRRNGQTVALGYAVQKGEGLIILTYETRVPFKLENDECKRGQKTVVRTKVAAPVRTDLAAPVRTDLAAPSLFEERELNQRERSSSPAAVTGPPTTIAESNPDPPKTPARAAPPSMNCGG